ncbi:MAG: hypothetical protein ABI442_12825 [Gemmatimonadaceae bacterium]
MKTSLVAPLLAAPLTLGAQVRQSKSIAVGKAADLLLLDADPLADIRNTRRIGVVIKNEVGVGR